MRWLLIATVLVAAAVAPAAHAAPVLPEVEVYYDYAPAEDGSVVLRHVGVHTAKARVTIECHPGACRSLRGGPPTIGKRPWGIQFRDLDYVVRRGTSVRVLARRPGRIGRYVVVKMSRKGRLSDSSGCLRPGRSGFRPRRCPGNAKASPAVGRPGSPPIASRPEQAVGHSPSVEVEPPPKQQPAPGGTTPPPAEPDPTTSPGCTTGGAAAPGGYSSSFQGPTTEQAVPSGGTRFIAVTVRNQSNVTWECGRHNLHFVDANGSDLEYTYCGTTPEWVNDNTVFMHEKSVAPGEVALFNVKVCGQPGFVGSATLRLQMVAEGIAHFGPVFPVMIRFG